MGPDERGKHVRIVHSPKVYSNKDAKKRFYMLFGIPSSRSGGCWIRLTAKEIKLLPVEWQQKWREATR